SHLQDSSELVIARGNQLFQRAVVLEPTEVLLDAVPSQTGLGKPVVQLPLLGLGPLCGGPVDQAVGLVEVRALRVLSRPRLVRGAVHLGSDLAARSAEAPIADAMADET